MIFGIFVIRGDTKIFFKAKSTLCYRLGFFLAEIADMPRLIHISCFILFAVRVSDNKAVLCTVFSQPVGFGSACKAVLCGVYIKGQTRLMF